MGQHLTINCSTLTRKILEILNRMQKDPENYQLIFGLNHEEAGEGDYPVPWDAWIDIVTDEIGNTVLEIEGGAGANGFGYCKVSVPLKDAGMYKIGIDLVGNKEIPLDLAKHVVVF